MGGNVTYFLLLAGAVLVLYVVSRLINRGTEVVAGTLTGNTRARGLAAVHLGLRFDVPVEGRRLVDQLVDTLDVTQESWSDGIRIAYLDDDHTDMVLVMGNRLAEHAKFLVTTEHKPEGGSSGDAVVRSWSEVEGRVPATEKIERIQKHVRAAVSHLGGSVTDYEST